MRMLVITTVLALAACTPPAQSSPQGEAGSTEPASAGKPAELEQPIASGAASGGSGLSQASGADQPCTLDNTSGVWSMIHIQSAEPGVQAFYRNAPYEYMRIGPTGSYAYFATNNAVAPSDVRGRIDQADAGDGVNDQADFRMPGVFVVLRDGQPFQAVRCVIAGGAGARHQPGDMVWTEYDGMADLYRVQRRVD